MVNDVRKIKNIGIDPWLLTLKQYELLKNLLKGSKIKFEEIELSNAETLFKLYDLETQNLISQIR